MEDIIYLSSVLGAAGGEQSEPACTYIHASITANYSIMYCVMLSVLNTEQRTIKSQE